MSPSRLDPSRGPRDFHALDVLVGAALAWQVLAVGRALTLVAGRDPDASPYLAAAALLGLGAGRFASPAGGRRAGLILAVATIALSVFFIPLLARTGPHGAVLWGVIFVGVPALAAGWGRPGLHAAPLTLGATLAALVGGLAFLPWLGPTPTGLLAAGALLVVALLGRRTDTGDAVVSRATPTELVSRMAALPIGLVLAAAPGFALELTERPLPFAATCAGFVGLGLFFGRRLADMLVGVPYVAVTVVLGLLLPWHVAFRESGIRDLIASDTRHVEGVTWGFVALVLAALVHGLPVGLLGGLALGRRRDVGLAGDLVLAGVGVLLVGLTGLSAATNLGLGAALLFLMALLAGIGRLTGGAWPSRPLVAGWLVALVLALTAWPAWLQGRRSEGRELVRVGGHELSLTHADEHPWSEQFDWEVDGWSLARLDVTTRPDMALAGHLAGLLSPERGPVLVASSLGGEVVRALVTEGFEEIAVHEPRRSQLELNDEAWRASFEADDASGFLREMGLTELADDPANADAFGEALGTLEADEAIRVRRARRFLLAVDDERLQRHHSPSPLDWSAEPESLAVLINQVDDPSVPGHEAFFTPAAVRRAAELLAPDGTYIWRLRLDRLGPVGLVSCLQLLREEFPATWVVTADNGDDGAVLALALKSHGVPRQLPATAIDLADGRAEPWTTERQQGLARALVFRPRNLLDAIVAPAETLTKLHPEAAALDLWTPGADAFRHPAPREAALVLGQALLHAGPGIVELAFDVTPGSHQEGRDAWPFLGIETSFKSGWKQSDAIERRAQGMVEHFGRLGVHREASRRMVFTREKGRLAVTERPASQGGPALLTSSIQSRMDQDVRETLRARIHGHEALGLFREAENLEWQEVHLTWHCPVQGRLFMAEYQLEDGIPGRHAPIMDDLGQMMRCLHPRPTSRTSAALSVPSGAGQP
ncbi:MAG: hypothetical protein AAF533_20205 [Acidobacteriota bacterium]